MGSLHLLRNHNIFSAKTSADALSKFVWQGTSRYIDYHEEIKPNIPPPHSAST